MNQSSDGVVARGPVAPHSGGSPPEIETRALTKIYTGSEGPVPALVPTDLSIPKGEFVCFLGPSGCGKTTLLRMLGGLLAPTTGEILIEGHPLWDGERRNDEVISDLGFVFQDASLFPWRSVQENVTLPLELRGVNRDERMGRAHELLDLVGLSGFATARPNQLSGGMQQRVAIARALAHEPEILLMDEPFGALDAMTRQQMNIELLRLWRETQRTVVLVTHSIQEALFLADRVVSLTSRPGRVARITEVPFGRPRNTDLLRNGEFLQHVQELHELLEEGDGSA